MDGLPSVPPQPFCNHRIMFAEYSFANTFPLSYRRLLPSALDGEGDFLFPIDLKVLLCFAISNLTNPQVKNGETISKSPVVAPAILK